MKLLKMCKEKNENVQGEERKCAERRKRRIKMCREKKEQGRKKNENVQGEE